MLQLFEDLTFRRLDAPTFGHFDELAFERSECSMLQYFECSMFRRLDVPTL
jgi:hypothetical protein